VTENPFIYEINTWVWLDVLDVVWKAITRAGNVATGASPRARFVTCAAGLHRSLKGIQATSRRSGVHDTVPSPLV
jgi:hypothetical protein